MSSRYNEWLQTTPRPDSDVWYLRELERFKDAPELGRTVGELEGRVSYTQLVRFPSSPRAVDAAYWANAAEAWEHLRDSSAWVLEHPSERFRTLIQRLNRIMLTGESGQSYYRPSSAVVGKFDVHPGEWWTMETRTAAPDEDGRVRILGGPRVQARMAGGQAYYTALARSVEDIAAITDARDYGTDAGYVTVPARGRPWGALVRGYYQDEEPDSWFLPARPLSMRHIDQLTTAWVAGMQTGDLAELGRFHWRFIHLHPFMAGNQSVAMMLVNWALARQREQGRGVGPIPHLLLDNYAMRFALAPYVRLFRRAVHAWSVPPQQNPPIVQRQRRELLFTFLNCVFRMRTPEEVDAFHAQHIEAGRLALLFLRATGV